MGPIFGRPTFSCVPAKATVQARYAIFLAAVEPGWTEILDVEVGKQTITVVGDGDKQVHVAARDLAKIKDRSILMDSQSRRRGN